MADISTELDAFLKGEAPTASSPTPPTPVETTPTSPSLETELDSFLSGTPVTPTAPIQDMGTRDLVSAGVVQPAIEEFATNVENLANDPFGTIKEGLVSTAESGGQFLKAIWDSKLQTAMSVGGELAGKAGRRIPFGGQLGELSGLTAGKMIEEDLDFEEASRNALMEMVAGRTLAKVGGSIMKVGQNTPSERIKDITLEREVAENVTRTWNEAQQQLGLEKIPSFLGVKPEYTSSLGKKLDEKISQASIRAGGIGDTAFFKEVVENAQKTYEKAFAGNTKTPNLSKLDDNLKGLTRNAMNKRLEGVGEIADMNNKIASKSRAVLDVTGLTSIADELATKAGARLGNDDIAEAFSIVNSVLRKPAKQAREVATGVLDAEGKPLTRTVGRDVPASQITLKEWASMENQLDALVGKFSENKARQDEIAGVVKRIKDEIITPYEKGAMALAKEANGAMHPDLVKYVANKNFIKSQYRGLDEVLGTRLAQIGGKTEIAMARKAMNETKLFKDAVSSAEAYRQTSKLLNEVNPEGKILLDDRIIVDSLATLKGDKGVITAKNVSKLIGTAAQPTARREVLEQVNPQLVQTLENIRLVQEGVESFVAKGVKDTDKSTAELFTNLATGTFAGQQLIAGTARKGLIAKTLKNIQGRVAETDRPLLEKLTGERGVKAIEDALAYRVYDDKVYNTYRRIVTGAGVRPLNPEEFQAAIDEYVGATQDISGETNPTLAELLLGE